MDQPRMDQPQMDRNDFDQKFTAHSMSRISVGKRQKKLLFEQLIAIRNS